MAENELEGQVAKLVPYQPIHRDIVVDRLFSLGEYKNIRFTDTITGLPQEIVFNQHLVDKIRFLQMVTVDLAYQAYKKLNVETLKRESKGEDVLAYLEEVKVNTLEELKGLLNGNLKE